MYVWPAKSMNFFKVINLLTFLGLLMIIMFFITACSEETLPDLPKQKSAILFRGYPYSGIHEVYWKYNLKNKELTQLENQEYIDLLDYIYYQGNENNIDEKKVEHHYDIIGRNIANEFYSKLLSRINFNQDDKPEIKYTVPDDDNLISQDHLMKVISDHTDNKISIIDLKTKKQKDINIDTRFWGQVLSPDDNYVAFFVHQPYAFTDGSAYKVCAIDLKTGEVFVIHDLLVSLPTAILWVEERK